MNLILNNLENTLLIPIPFLLKFELHTVEAIRGYTSWISL